MTVNSYGQIDESEPNHTYDRRVAFTADENLFWRIETLRLLLGTHDAEGVRNPVDMETVMKAAIHVLDVLHGQMQPGGITYLRVNRFELDGTPVFDQLKLGGQCKSHAPEQLEIPEDVNPHIRLINVEGKS